ncbi:hypothetical protein HG536_0C02770 [Torulaspora globosa]|uniref:DH domain-containing protein n=1 Tax=Torulaspora globosa TaxID=48254 RepID=A0A7G3ZF22_9SACH|nr:uncharacterized protein HG536_0C02770 [Torulaspora globosa]QLL32108.1 hypothetical protein HG536_0C02770 [Torulaspora globosa]
MVETELSSIYSCDTQQENAVRTHRTAKKIRLADNLLSQHARNRQWVEARSFQEWIEVFKESAFYEGFDELQWGQFFVCIYKDPATGKLSSLIIDKLGVTHFNPLDISSDSQYYPAIENLDPKDRDSNVRKCIAVSLLQKFAQATEAELRAIQPQGLRFDYDPTHAGDLASGCKLVEVGTPENVGRAIVSLGYLQQRYAHGSLFDVVYEQKPSTTDSNNRIVFNLGEQLEQLFDPLSEYSPEQTEYTYKPPETDEGCGEDDAETKLIIDELFQLQTAFTLNLVEFLQSFLIALRVQVLNNEIGGLSTVKLNRLFPPTIDEVTRINCIFLDFLRSAVPYGSLEVLKACSLAIPYFYKAYTRHEAATKNFNKDLKLFFRTFRDVIPHKDVYTEMKIETIVKGPQDKLVKIKLIIDRLFTTRKWESKDLPQAKEYYRNVTGTIDAFGKLESPLSSYSTRVFTPSGKILTELAKGWPVELQYKWLRRRVVGVFDIVEETCHSKRMLLVIFSDYVVFLDINRADVYYNNNGRNRPQISDVLMNSLINEVPLPPKIPKLTVAEYCFIDDLFVSSLENGSLRFDSLKEDNAFSIICRPAPNTVSNSTVAELVIKAKILEKETAFHLFRASHDDIKVYLTAHELEAYQNENIKSKFAIFLNMDPSPDLLPKFKLHLAAFLKFTTSTSEELLQLDIVTSDGRNRSTTVLPEKIVPQLINELTTEMPMCYSSVCSPILPELLKISENLIKRIADSSRQRDHGSEDADPADRETTGSFNPEHEKKKSFGTITTYRSHVSDLKDVKIESQSSHKRETVRQENQPTAAKQKQKAYKADQQPLSARKSNSNKRRSIVNAVLRLFGAKSRPTDKTRSRNKKMKKASKTIKDQEKTVGPISVLESNRNAKEVNAISNQRITSVIRKPENVPPTSSMQSPNHDREKVSERSFGKECVTSEVQKNPNHLLISSRFETPIAQTSTDTEQAESPIIDSSHIAIEHTSTAGLYMQTDRQSQLFDDDLFGDLIPKPSESKTSDDGSTAEGPRMNSNERGQLAGLVSKEQTAFNQVDCIENYEKKYQEPAATSSGKDSSLFTDNDTVPNAKTIEESGTPSKAFADQRNTQDTKELLHNKSELLATTPKQTVSEPKERIFPSIPVMRPSKISFDRSSSFIELFEGMRLVLDESDAQYNWKCLSNDLSSNRQSRAQDCVPHAFKSIAMTTNSSPSIDCVESSSSQTSEGQSATTEGSRSSLTNDAATIIAEEESAAQLQDAIFLEKEAVSEIKVIKAVPTFKLVKASPTRIVKRASQHLESESTEQSLRYNFSISSDLSKVTDKRWFELRLPSQDDLEVDGFYTPIEEPSPKFAQEQRNGSETSSPFESNGNANETSEESISSDGNKPKDKDPVLEDVDFSSFHVTFDTVGSKTEGSPDTACYIEQEGDYHSLSDRLPSMDHSKQGPLVYRLPVYPPQETLRSSASGFSTNLTVPGASHDDDDPIWVSPSKLEFYDLTNVVDTKTRSQTLKTRGSGVVDRHESVAAVERDDLERNSLRELSYAYLASFLSPTESQDVDDGPVRLQFKE